MDLTIFRITAQYPLYMTLSENKIHKKSICILPTTVLVVSEINI